MNVLARLKMNKIMLVDDNEHVRHSMGLFFRLHGVYHFAACKSAEEAIKLIENQSFDIIIIDYKLPGLSGLGFLDKIKETCKDAIKIMISGHADNSVIDTAYKLGLDDFISKPVTIEKMQKSLQKVMGRSINKRE
jgi:DNA-binding NtrC family response regulator